jgi:hypothetical protein
MVVWKSELSEGAIAQKAAFKSCFLSDYLNVQLHGPRR